MVFPSPPSGDKLKKRLNIFSESLGRSARLVRGDEGSRISRRQAQGGCREGAALIPVPFPLSQDSF